MSGTSEQRQRLIDLEHGLVKRLSSAWDGFVDFAFRENVLEVALGLILASAFTTVVNSLVANIILPPISLLPFIGRDLPEKFAILKEGPNADQGYNTLKQARDDGAIALAYGLFIEQVVTFLGIGMTLYLLAQLYGLLSHDNIIRRTIKCRYCRKWCSEKAKRCPMCTTWLDGREDRETSALAQ
ncbi:putative ion channel [Athelia psychrophila]|uniref:Ion channel n=1 Tax=Athelia psychrophila TaxID=1759441 RepID=A0A166CV12_9AGAM|nr:putative ion channel [Fibularhizoctonia sp. CBS 109695]